MKRLFLLLMLLSQCLIARSVRADFESFGEAFDAGADDFAAQNYAESRANYNKALALAKIDRERNMVYFSLGQIDLSEGKPAAARSRFEQILASKPEDFSLRFMAIQNVGITYMAEEKYDAAREEFGKALADEGASRTLKSTVQIQIATSYLSEKKYSQARAELVKLLDYQKASPVVVFVVPLLTGTSYLEEGDFLQARSEFVKVLALDENEMVRANPASKSMLQSVTLIFKAQAQSNVAKSYFLEKNLAQAKVEYDKLLLMEKVSPISKAEAEKQLKLIAELEAQQKQAPKEAGK